MPTDLELACSRARYVLDVFSEVIERYFFIILAMIVAAAFKYEKLRHPATYLAIGVNVFNFLLEPLGRSEAIQQVLKTIVKG